MDEYIPENNLVVLFLLIVLTFGLYYFWWLARTSKLFNDDPVINILLTIFTFGIWGIYLKPEISTEVRDTERTGC